MWLFVTPYLGSRDTAYAYCAKTFYNGEVHQSSVNSPLSPQPIESCEVNRQYGVGNSKYMVISDPRPEGHVTRRWLTAKNDL